MLQAQAARDRETIAELKAEVGEMRDSLLLLGPAQPTLSNGVCSDGLGHGMAVICEAEPGSRQELLDQKTEVLRQRLAEQEAEASMLRQELLRRQQQLQAFHAPQGFECDLQAPENEESDAEEENGRYDAQEDVPMPTREQDRAACEKQGRFAREPVQPLARELREARQKVKSLGRQLEYERDATSRLEQESRQIHGYDPFVEAFQASSALQRELQREISSATRSLSKVMFEYQQQWSALTAQVDILEHHSLLCEGEVAKGSLPSPPIATPPRATSGPVGSSSGGPSQPVDPIASPRGQMRSARHGPRPAPQASHSSSSGPPRSRKSVSPSKAGDEIDQMWCRTLRRVPDRAGWVLVKERPGVYRLGHPGGRAVHSRVTHAGLQVRIGGGWTSAEAFLRRHGYECVPPAGITASDFISGNGVDRGVSKLCGSFQLPTGRVLSPTKSWASRIGIPRDPDLRQRRTTNSTASVEETSGDTGAGVSTGMRTPQPVDSFDGCMMLASEQLKAGSETSSQTQMLNVPHTSSLINTAACTPDVGGGADVSSNAARPSIAVGTPFVLSPQTITPHAGGLVGSTTAALSARTASPRQWGSTAAAFLAATGSRPPLIPSSGATVSLPRAAVAGAGWPLGAPVTGDSNDKVAFLTPAASAPMTYALRHSLSVPSFQVPAVPAPSSVTVARAPNLGRKAS